MKTIKKADKTKKIKNLYFKTKLFIKSKPKFFRFNKLKLYIQIQKYKQISQMFDFKTII